MSERHSFFASFVALTAGGHTRLVRRHRPLWHARNHREHVEDLMRDHGTDVAAGRGTPLNRDCSHLLHQRTALRARPFSASGSMLMWLGNIRAAVVSGTANTVEGRNRRNASAVASTAGRMYPASEPIGMPKSTMTMSPKFTTPRGRRSATRRVRRRSWPMHLDRPAAALRRLPSPRRTAGVAVTRSQRRECPPSTRRVLRQGCGVVPADPNSP